MPFYFSTLCIASGALAEDRCVLYQGKRLDRTGPDSTLFARSACPDTAVSPGFVAFMVYACFVASGNTGQTPFVPS